MFRFISPPLPPPLQCSIAYGASRPHNSVRGSDFHILSMYKNQTLSRRRHRTLAKHTDTSQSLARINNLLVSPDYSDDCNTVPSSSQTLPSTHTHTHLHINIIRHACTSLLWWMTSGDSGSEHPLLALISHCHKSIRQRGMLDVFIALRSFGATGLTSSRQWDAAVWEVLFCRIAVFRGRHTP